MGNIYERRRIRPIEDNTKSLRLQSDLERDFVAAVYLFEAPSPPRVLPWRGLQILLVLNLTEYSV